MKIITAYQSKSSADSTGLNVMVWPDSSMIRSRKPIFIPEEENTSVIPGLVVRITGVGKTIREKFATRYYDEIAPMAIVVNEDTAKKIAEHQDPLACEIIADYSVIIGDFIPFGNPEQRQTPLNLKLDIVRVNSPTRETVPLPESLTLEGIETHIGETIAMASRKNTLKTGDFVGFLQPTGYEISSDDILKIDINGETLLENKIK